LKTKVVDLLDVASFANARTIHLFEPLGTGIDFAPFFFLHESEELFHGRNRYCTVQRGGEYRPIFRDLGTMPLLRLRQPKQCRAS
jgi:hypothetical protein